MLEPKIAAAYIRVSTEDQLEYSPDAQLAEIKRYAATNGYRLPDEYIFIDEGISGRNTARRENFNLMIGKAKTKPKPFDAILLWKFSRFARNREDSIVYKSMLRKQLGINVISITEPVGDEKMSILIEALIEAMDEYYSINLAEEVRRGMTEKARRGGLQSNPSFGYSIDKLQNVLVIIPEEAEIIREIFLRFVSGDTLLGIAKSLNSRGIRTHKGNKFEGRTVDYIIHNPVYIGMLRWNPSGHTKRNHWDSPDLIISPGMHKAIIDMDTWNLAQNRANNLKLKHIPNSHSPEFSTHWLSGIIRCSSCGATLICAQHRWFKCSNYCRGSCKISQHISADILERIIVNRLKHDSENANGMQLKAICNSDKNIDDIANIKKAIETIIRKKDRLREAFLAGVDTIADYKRTSQELNIEQVSLEKRLNVVAESDAYAPAKTLSYANIDEAFSAIFSDTIDSIKRHDAATEVIESCVWNKEEKLLTIVYRICI